MSAWSVGIDRLSPCAYERDGEKEYRSNICIGTRFPEKTKSRLSVPGFLQLKFGTYSLLWIHLSGTHLPTNPDFRRLISLRAYLILQSQIMATSFTSCLRRKRHVKQHPWISFGQFQKQSIVLVCIQIGKITTDVEKYKSFLIDTVSIFASLDFKMFFFLRHYNFERINLLSGALPLAPTVRRQEGLSTFL